MDGTASHGAAIRLLARLLVEVNRTLLTLHLLCAHKRQSLMPLLHLVRRSHGMAVLRGECMLETVANHKHSLLICSSMIAKAVETSKRQHLTTLQLLEHQHVLSAGKINIYQYRHNHPTSSSSSSSSSSLRSSSSLLSSSHRHHPHQH
uniref:Uncharacterized protein n=1 Tax=Glossina pallidipes TaxID=7398 RepID=A0A1B0A9I6_GLOPL